MPLDLTEVETTLQASNAGLASENTLAEVASELQGTLSIKVDGNTVGLASETTLSDVLSAVQGTKGVSLQANNAGTLSIKIDADNAGLASQSTLSSVLSELQGTLTVTDDGGFSASTDDGTGYPSETVVGADLSSGTLTVGPLIVPQTQALIVAANPTGGGDFSLSVQWTDGTGNVFQTQSASELSINGATTEQNARLFRKGLAAVVAVQGSDTSLNLFVGTHR